MAGNRPDNKSTHEQQEYMKNLAADYILDNDVTRKQFTEWFKSKFPRITSDRHAHNYWKWGWERVAKMREEDKKNTRAKRVTQLEYQLSASEDPMDKAKILMMIAKLEGIDVNRMEVETSEKKAKPLFLDPKMNDILNEDKDE